MKHLVKIATLILALMLIVNATLVPAMAEDNMVLNVWISKSFNPDADARLEARIKSFADVSDRVSEIKVEQVAAMDVQTRVNAAIESGNVPDLCMVSATMYPTFVALNLLEDVTDVVSDVEAHFSPIIPSIKELLTINDCIYALPLNTNANMLTYRTDLFEQAGITEIPRTWAEVSDVCQKLSQNVSGVYPFGHAIGASDDSETANLMIMRAFGGRYWDEAGNVVVNSPETIEAVKYITGLYNAGYIPASTVEWDSAGNNNTYLAGESAMVINLTTLYNAVLTKEDSAYRDCTAIASLPGGDYDFWKEPGCQQYGIFKGVQDVEVSKALLSYLLEEEWYEGYMEMNFPVSVPVYTRITETEKWSEGTMGGELIAQAQKECKRPGYPCTDELVQRTDAQAQANFFFSNTLLRVILQGQSPEDSVAQLADELTSLKEELALQVD